MGAHVRVLAFAGLREVLGFGSRDVALGDATTIDDLWQRLAADVPALSAYRDSTRFARNGELTAAETGIGAGDEIAFLPPVGGG